MKFAVSDRAIDVEAAKNAVTDSHCGAFVTFEGWIRDHNEGQAVERLEYEVYRPVAEKEGAKIIDEALADPNAQRFIGDNEVRKTIVVPGRLVNIVV
jgi:molybdopterin synthase catalytic subunit